MTWRAVGVSVEGAGHRVRGAGCEDAHLARRTDTGLVLVVADGAGSAARSQRGAEAVVTAVGDVLAGADVADLALVAVAIGRARAALEAEARDVGCPLGDLATTVHVAWLAGERLLTGQIGDGAVVVRSGGGLRSLDAADRGEYLNETVFLTSSAWDTEARFGAHDASDIDAIALMTDGLQLLAFDLAEDAPHAGFFEPMFSWVVALGDGEGAMDRGRDELAAFLASERVQSRTDDDTTLVLAVRG